jgi:carboxymethylenebutenolidase
MTIETTWVRHGEGEEYTAFTARPGRAALPLPSVIVIQEAGGVDAHIEDVTRRVAAAGYFAIAPDLFSERGARWPAFTRERMAEMMELFNSMALGTAGDAAAREAALARMPAEQAGRVRETVEQLFTGGVLRLERYLPQLRATADFVRRDNAATRAQKVAVMGFCMGGGLTGLFACHDPDLAAAAIFYGMSPAAELVERVRCPVVGFYGASDPRVNDTVPAFAEAMKRAGKSFEAHTYAGAGHAFFNDSRNTYEVGAARDSFARLLALFRRHLG